MALELLKNIPLLNGKQYQPHIVVPGSWFLGEEFVEILNKERNRSERNGLPLSFVLMDLSNLNKNDGILDSARHRFLKKLIAMVSENTRIFDVKYYCDPDKIGILLIDTGIDGAKAFAEKIFSKLGNHNNSDQPKNYVDLIASISTSIFPIRNVPDREIFEGAPQIDDLMSTNSSAIRLNWNASTLDNMTSPILEPKFRDIIFGKNHSGNSKFIRRCIDVLGSVLGIIVSSPLMVIICVLIKATSRGPILFKQKRLGYLGETFTFLKFRTMRTDSDDTVHREYVEKLIEGNREEVNRGSKKQPLYKLDNDTRVTGFGRILRKTSLDELPQLFNVLVGHMSIVGPRPPLPYEVEKYQSWHWRRIMEIKPGITGLWQVYGRSRTTHAEMVRLDLKYIKNQSILLDLKIISKTFFAMLNTKGAL